MTIRVYKAFTKRNVRGTHVVPDQTLYAIQKGSIFFIWSFSDLATAMDMDKKLSGPSNYTDEGANWRKELEVLIPSDRKL